MPFSAPYHLLLIIAVRVHKYPLNRYLPLNVKYAPTSITVIIWPFMLLAKNKINQYNLVLDDFSSVSTFFNDNFPKINSKVCYCPSDYDPFAVIV